MDIYIHGAKVKSLTEHSKINRLVKYIVFNNLEVYVQYQTL